MQQRGKGQLKNRPRKKRRGGKLKSNSALKTNVCERNERSRGNNSGKRTRGKGKRPRSEKRPGPGHRGNVKPEGHGGILVDGVLAELLSASWRTMTTSISLGSQRPLLWLWRISLGRLSFTLHSSHLRMSTGRRWRSSLMFSRHISGHRSTTALWKRAIAVSTPTDGGAATYSKLSWTHRNETLLKLVSGFHLRCAVKEES